MADTSLHVRWCTTVVVAFVVTIPFASFVRAEGELLLGVHLNHLVLIWSHPSHDLFARALARASCGLYILLRVLASNAVTRLRLEINNDEAANEIFARYAPNLSPEIKTAPA